MEQVCLQVMHLQTALQMALGLQGMPFIAIRRMFKHWVMSIIGIVAAFVIYYAIANNDRNVKKRILTWGGGCVAMLCMTIALPKFFDYQESGLLAGNTNSSGGSSGDFAGGDRWGKIDITIPDINNPIWRPDHRFDPILRPGTGIIKPDIKLSN